MTYNINVKRYDFSQLLLDIILLQKKSEKSIKLSGGNIFLCQGYCQKIRVHIRRNRFSRRNKYVHL